MILVVSGCRDYDNYEFFSKEMDNYLISYDPMVMHLEKIIFGDATGVDAMAKKYCEHNSIEYKEYEAKWKQFGYAAGPIRNRMMANVGTHLIAFWDGKSRGTKNMIDEAKTRGLNIKVIDI